MVCKYFIPFCRLTFYFVEFPLQYTSSFKNTELRIFIKKFSQFYSTVDLPIALIPKAWLICTTPFKAMCTDCHRRYWPEHCCCCWVTSVVSDSVWPHRWQPTRLCRPWDSPGKNNGVGCHFLLQCMKVKSESVIAQLCLTLSDPMDRSLPGSSVHGIFQARVLEWGAIVFSGPEHLRHIKKLWCSSSKSILIDTQGIKDLIWDPEQQG